MDSLPPAPPGKQICFVKILFYYVNCFLYIKFCSCLPSVYLGLQSWTSNLFSILLLRQLNSSNARSFRYTLLCFPSALAKRVLSSRPRCVITSIESYSSFPELHRRSFSFPNMLPHLLVLAMDLIALMSEKTLVMNRCLATGKGLGWLSEATSQAVQGHPGRMGRGEECSQKRAPLEEGMADHFSVLASRTPWTVWKDKKTSHWKISPSGWQLSNMLPRESGRHLLTAPERTKRLGQIGNDAQLWMCLWWKHSPVL